jgi:AcrR family transcriptional regulator
MTKIEIIEQTARELFWKHGFKKVSIDEICKKAQVSRKTFYTYYPNKNALVIRIMKLITDSIFSDSQAVVDSEASFSEKIDRLLKIKYLANKNFSIEFATDFFHPDSTEILKFFNELTQKSLAFTRNFYEQAQQKGEMNPNLNIDFVMWMMQKQLEIITSDEALKMFADAEIMTKQLSQLMIYGVMPIREVQKL